MRLKELMLFSLFTLFASCLPDEKSACYVAPDEVEAIFLLSCSDMKSVSVIHGVSTGSVVPVTQLSHLAPSANAVNELTLEQESAFRTVSYFEFNGMSDESRCIKKGAVVMTVKNLTALRLSKSNNMHTIYVVVNLGDVTGSVKADKGGTKGTTIAEFLTNTFSYSGRENLALHGIPMIGFDRISPAHDQQGTFQLKRLLGKIRFSCKEQLPEGDSFVFGSMRLKNVPNTGLYKTQAYYPDNSIAENFHHSLSSLTPVAVWYIPQNRRGVSWAKSEEEKSQLAPAHSTCVEVEGKYTTEGVTYLVSYTVYLGSNAVNSYEIIRNRMLDVSFVVTGLNSYELTESVTQ